MFKMISGVVLAASIAAAAESPVKVTKTDNPEKALFFEVTVPVKPDEVWRAFTTKEGAEEWLWPHMTVELREGGDWIVHYPGGKTGGGTIVSFEPMQSITLRAMAPEQFPEVRRERTTAVFRFEPAESGTKVTLLADGMEAGQGMGRCVRISGRWKRAIAGAASVPVPARAD